MKRRKLIVLLLAVLMFATLGFFACNPTADPVDKTVQKLKVTFTGDGFDSFTVEVETGKPVTKPTDPKRDGYTLEGWTDADGNLWSFDTPVNADMTLTAKWTLASYSISLNPNGAKLDGDVKEVKVNANSSYDLPVPVHDKYVFMGWMADNKYITDAEGHSLDVFNDSKNINAIASWTFADEGGFIYYQLKETDTLHAVAKDNFKFPETLTFADKVQEKTVGEIGDMSKLTSRSIVVPANIQLISDSAFNNNVYINEADLSAFKGEIGHHAFANTHLQYIDLGGTTKIGEEAFSGTELALIYIPESVTAIEAKAFNNTKNLIEVGFGGNFPTLGDLVFGDGTDKNDDYGFSIIASEAAWNALTENAEGETLAEKIEAATGLKKADIYQWTQAMIDSGKEVAGRYDGEAVIYMGIGFNAIIVYNDATYVSSVYDGKSPSDHCYLTTQTEKITYYLDKETKTSEAIAANASGEVIKDGWLYDYVGTDITYFVSHEVTSIAGGAGQMNETVRFLVINNEVTYIGSFAFSFGNLFGVSFGTGIAKIDEYAFFNQNYISSIIFYNETEAPEIGQAAFTIMTGDAYAPLTFNSMAQYGVPCYIYLQKPIEELNWDNWQYEEKEGAAFMNALNKSLEGLKLAQVGYQGSDEFTDAAYVKGDFKLLGDTKTGFAKQDASYTCDSLGEITMSGANNGYAYIRFSPESGYSGSSYIYFSGMPGYNFSYSSTESAPCKIQVFTGIVDGSAQSITLYGQFKDGKLVLRGAEAGTFGSIDSDYYVIDGYGKITYHKEDGSIFEGSYTIEENTLTVTEIEGVTSISVNPDKHEITVNGDVLSALGEEAGIYYDLQKRATLKLDGKAFEDNSDPQNIKYYSGKLTLVYNKVTTEASYTLNGTKLVFMLGDVEKSWTYSKTSEDVINGYYDENYDVNLKFSEASKGASGSFTNEGKTLVLDGFFTATLDDVEYGYFGFGESLLLFGEETTLYNLDYNAHTFAEPTAAEAGVYYITTSANYRVYLDGKGSILYDNGDYAVGTYSYEATTKEMKAWIGSNTDTSIPGFLNAEEGYGMLSYYSGYSDTICGISKSPFTQIASYKTVRIYYEDKEGEIQNESVSLNVYISGNIVFANYYGSAIQTFVLTGEQTSWEFEYSYENEDITATIIISVQKTGDSYSCDVAPKGAEVVEASLDGAAKAKYYFIWLDEEHTKLGIYEQGGWNNNIVCGKINEIDDNSFTVGDYTISGYGTDNVTISRT